MRTKQQAEDDVRDSTRALIPASVAKREPEPQPEDPKEQ